MNYGTQTDKAREYRRHELQHEIERATPHRLVQMMMERVLLNIAVAKGHMQRGSIGLKGEQISAAIDVISGLQISLNHKHDPRLSGNFDALYDYMSRRLVESNLKNDAAGLDEVADLMREIKMAWDTIGEQLGELPKVSAVGD